MTDTDNLSNVASGVKKSLRFCLVMRYTVHGTPEQRKRWDGYAEGYIAACEAILGKDFVDEQMQRNHLYRHGMKLSDKVMIHD